MRNLLILLLIICFFSSCQSKEKRDTLKKVDWESRKSERTNFNGFVQGKTYLPVYSHIYHRFEHHIFELTITTSIRNVSVTDSVYILKADFFNTQGEKVRKYIQNPIVLRPMETIEIIIEEDDKAGGSGANFVFDWAVKNGKNPPLFEAVMISTNGQQGLSFTTRGVVVHE